MLSYPFSKTYRKQFVTLAGWSYCNSGSGGVCGPLITGTYRSSMTVTDFVNRGNSPASWKLNIQRGQDATSGLEGVRYKVVRRDTYQTSFVYNSNPCIRGAGFGHLDLIFPSVSYVDSTTADMAARSRFLQDYISKRRLFAGANALAEFRETVSLLKRPVQALWGKTNRLATEAALIARRARLNISGPGSAKIQLARASEELGGAWLAWAWGVKPLFQDISEINTALDSYRDGSKIKVTAIRGDGMENVHVSNGQLVPAWLYAGNHGVYRQEGVMKRTLSVRYRAGVATVPTGPGGLLTQFGFDPFDIVPAVWEVVPYSHIVDYFTGVGEQLDAMRLAMAAPTWGYRTVRNVSTRVDGGLIVKADPGYTVTASGGLTETQAVFVSRSRLTQMPLPIFHFRLPSFGQWVNVGALATQGRRAKEEWTALYRRAADHWEASRPGPGEE